ncbi:MAG: TIGR02444 family protein [Amphritea sp.]|nr:TIGR02444 family protein [Amphritea sp.]
MNEDNEFWNYAIKVYSDPEIAEVCQALQNRFQLRVNRLLFALWLAEQGRVLPADLDEADSREWRLKLLEPLRSLRYQLRKSKRSVEEESCYQQLKTAELSAEKVEIGLLFKLKDHCSTAAKLSGLRYQNLCVAADTGTGGTGELQVLLTQLSDKAAVNGSI